MLSRSKRLTHGFTTSIFLLVIFCSIALIAQPSGGPYGPIQQTYDLPKVEGKIYYVAVTAYDIDRNESDFSNEIAYRVVKANIVEKAKLSPWIPLLLLHD